MNEHDAQSAAAQVEPIAPPIERPPPPPSRAVWPVVLGILGLFFAVIQVFGLLFVFGGSLFVSSPEEALKTIHPSFVGGMVYLGWVIFLLDIAMLVILIVAGIGLIRRRRFGITSARIYAIGILVRTTFTLVFTWLTWDTVVQNSQSEGLPAGFPITGMLIIVTAFSSIFSYGIGVGILAWLRSGAARRTWSTWS